MPIVALIGIFNGSVNIDTDRLHEMIAEQQSVAIESWTNVETAMTNAGYDSLRIQEAQALFTFALYDHAYEPDFASKLVGCFSAEQTDEELIAAVNAAFGTTSLPLTSPTQWLSTRAAYIDSSGLYRSHHQKQHRPCHVGRVCLRQRMGLRLGNLR